MKDTCHVCGLEKASVTVIVNANAVKHVHVTSDPGVSFSCCATLLPLLDALYSDPHMSQSLRSPT